MSTRNFMEWLYIPSKYSSVLLVALLLTTWNWSMLVILTFGFCFQRYVNLLVLYASLKEKKIIRMSLLPSALKEMSTRSTGYGVKPGFHIIASSRKESQRVAITVIMFACDSLRSYGNRLKNLLATSCDFLRSLSQGAAEIENLLSVRLTATRCDPLRLMETIVHNFCNSLR